jgi:hypothetical protein
MIDEVTEFLMGLCGRMKQGNQLLKLSLRRKGVEVLMKQCWQVLDRGSSSEDSLDVH